MYTNYEIEKVTPSDPYFPHFHGAFEIPVQVGTRTRRMLAYVPERCRESTAGVIVIGPDGKNADELFLESEWRRIADQEETKE